MTFVKRFINRLEEKVEIGLKRMGSAREKREKGNMLKRGEQKRVPPFLLQKKEMFKGGGGGERERGG